MPAPDNFTAVGTATSETVPVVNNFDAAQLGPAVTAIVKESKAGYKTTEFWVSLGVALLTVIDGIPLPEQYEGFVIAGIAAVYAVSRGLAKQGVPVVEKDPEVSA